MGFGSLWREVTFFMSLSRTEPESGGISITERRGVEGFPIAEKWKVKGFI